jgi:hypothetical protein
VAAADKGLQFESRVARLLVAEGAFVRRRVNLDAQFGERFTVTDIDVLATHFTPTLEIRRTAGECKTTESKGAPSAGDRLLWTNGLGALAQAERTFLAISKRARESERNIAALLASEIIDIRDLERREEIQGIVANDAFGSQDPELFRYRKLAETLARSDEELRRLFRFVTSELWLAPTVPRLKKALGAARRLGERWGPNLPPAEREPIKWMLAESIVGAIVGLVELAGTGYRQPEDAFNRELSERLAEGLADYRSLQQISQQIDKTLAGLITQLGVDSTKLVEVMGLFDPKPPAYTESLGELLERLARAPSATAMLPRMADDRYALALGARFPSVSTPPDRGADRLLRLIAAFFEGQIRVPADCLSPLRLPRSGEPSPTPPSGESSNGADRATSTQAASLFE